MAKHFVSPPLKYRQRVIIILLPLPMGENNTTFALSVGGWCLISIAIPVPCGGNI